MLLAMSTHDWNRRQILRHGGAALAATSLQGARASITLRAIEPDGRPAAEARMRSLLATDPDGRPFELLPQIQDNDTATLELPSEKFELMMVLPVRGFGQVYLYADNGGSLYSPADFAGTELLLNYEFARSRAAFVRRYVEAARADGVSFDPATLRRLELGEAALEKASAAKELDHRAADSNDSLAETMWAGEMAALERARHRISRGGPRSGFLFGCNAFRFDQSEDYARLYTRLLNYATLPFYRAGTERAEGEPDYSRVESLLGKMAATSLVTKGHPLVWFHRAGVPEFLRDKSWEELQDSCRDYILRSVLRFRSRIRAWDVINEAHDWANDLQLTQDQLLEMTRLAAETTRLGDPTAFRVVNSCCTWAEYVATRRSYSGPLNRPARTPLEYVRALEDARVPYEAIGLQVYYPSRDMLEIERHIERYFRFGKPIHITELGVPTSSEPVQRGQVRQPNRNVWHGTEWTEEIQADWIEQFYTICYSKPEIEAITWWDFSDPAFIPHGGLLTADMKPKPGYERLASLLASWQRPPQ